jgi:hypothetical protein
VARKKKRDLKLCFVYFFQKLSQIFDQEKVLILYKTKSYVLLATHKVNALSLGGF